MIFHCSIELPFSGVKLFLFHQLGEKPLKQRQGFQLSSRMYEVKRHLLEWWRWSFHASIRLNLSWKALPKLSQTLWPAGHIPRQYVTSGWWKNRRELAPYLGFHLCVPSHKDFNNDLVSCKKKKGLNKVEPLSCALSKWCMGVDSLVNIQ